MKTKYNFYQYRKALIFQVYRCAGKLEDSVFWGVEIRLSSMFEVAVRGYWNSKFGVPQSFTSAAQAEIQSGLTADLKVCSTPSSGYSNFGSALVVQVHPRE